MSEKLQIQTVGTLNGSEMVTANRNLVLGKSEIDSERKGFGAKLEPLWSVSARVLCRGPRPYRATVNPKPYGH